MTRRERREFTWAMVFISPWIVGLLGFILIPCVLSFYFSFCDYSVLNRPAVLGLNNYANLAYDEVFRVSLWNTIVFAVMALPLGTFTALALAILLNSKLVARDFFRTVFFLPSLVPLVALAVLWRYLLNADYGLVNVFLGWFGLPPIEWLGVPVLAKPGLVLTGLWGVGQAVVIYLAGLQDVPPSLYEAARVDGANWWQQTLNITLPMISPVIYFNLIMGCIGVLQVFALPYVMTGGGPVRATLFYAMYLFDQAFMYLNMGYASAMAWVLFALIAVLTYTAHRLSHKHVVYGVN